MLSMVKNEGRHSEKIKTNRRSAAKENGSGQYVLPNKNAMQKVRRLHGIFCAGNVLAEKLEKATVFNKMC